MFEARLRNGRRCVLFILLEHQSRPDPRMPWRVALYAMARWSRWIRNNPGWKKLPPVIPVVLYHGTRPWSGPTRLDELVDLPDELREAALIGPTMPFQLCALDTLLDANPPADPLLRVTLEALQFSRHPDLFEKIDGWSEPLSKVEHSKRLPIVHDTLNYLLAVLPTPDHNRLEAHMRTQTLPDVINYPTIRDHLLAEGREAGLAEGHEAGLAEGRQHGERALLRRLLIRRFGPLTSEQEQRIEAADEATLTRWSDGLFDAASAADLLD